MNLFDVIVTRRMKIDQPAMKISLGLMLLSFLLFAGCGTGTTMRPVPIAGGKIVGIPFGPRGPLAGQANGYEVLYAASVPVPNTKEIVYKFAFSAPPSTSLKRVVVDDISDEQSSSMINDEKPWLDDKNSWRTESKPFDAKNPLLAWVYTVTPSMRVYRFTITDSTGKQTVLYQLTGYPEFLKGAMRTSWGEKY